MYNKVILIGRLTATPEMVKTARQWLSGGVWLRP